LDTFCRVVGTKIAYLVILKILKDYEEKTGRPDSRFILVAPKIPENLKRLLDDDGLEYREIEFSEA